MGESGKAAATDRLRTLSFGRRRNLKLLTDCAGCSDRNLMVPPDGALRSGRRIQPHIVVRAVMMQHAAVRTQMLLKVPPLHCTVTLPPRALRYPCELYSPLAMR